MTEQLTPHLIHTTCMYVIETVNVMHTIYVWIITTSVGNHTLTCQHITLCSQITRQAPARVRPEKLLPGPSPLSPALSSLWSAYCGTDSRDQQALLSSEESVVLLGERTGRHTPAGQREDRSMMCGGCSRAGAMQEQGPLWPGGWGARG